MKIKLSVETFFYFLALIIGIFFRFYQLGELPLNDIEASAALQALGQTSHISASSSSNPLYTILTGFLFQIFGVQNNLARLVPAIIGSLFILVPALYKHTLGQKTAVILAFMIAMDPAIVSISRDAGSSMLAVCALFVLIGLLLQQNWKLVGVMLVLGLLSGSEFWFGALIFVIDVIWLRFSDKSTFNRTIELYKSEEKLPSKMIWLQVGLGALFTLISIGSGFFTSPEVIGGIGSSVFDFLSSWNPLPDSSLGFPFWMIIIGIIVTYPFPLVLSLFSYINFSRRKYRYGLILVQLLIISLLLTLLSPAREMITSVWFIIFLWVFVATIIDRSLNGNADQPFMQITTIILQLILFIFGILHLLGYLNTPFTVDMVSAQLHLAALLGSGIIFLVLIGLLAWGWGWHLVRDATKISIILIGIFYQIFLVSRAAGWGQHPDNEIWNQAPLPLEGVLLNNTLLEISLQNTGFSNQIDLVVVDLEYPSLRWALREFPNTMFTNGDIYDLEPSLLVTSNQFSPELEVSYRGQDFVWGSEPSWSLMAGTEWFNWLVYREVVREQTDIILWARNDLFPNNGFGEPQTTPSFLEGL